MTKMKTAAILGAAILMVGALSFTAYAASNYNTPAEAAAGVTGKTVDEVVTERQDTGKTYGEIAAEAGKLEEFKDEVLEIKKDTLEEQVAAGTITQEQADEIVAALEENAATCDGTGSAAIGQNYGAAFGNGDGTCDGTCTGDGSGNAYKGTRGNGDGTCDGTCAEDGSGNAYKGTRGNGDGTCDGTCTEDGSGNAYKGSRGNGGNGGSGQGSCLN